MKIVLTCYVLNVKIWAHQDIATCIFLPVCIKGFTIHPYNSPTVRCEHKTCYKSGKWQLLVNKTNFWNCQPKSDGNMNMK